VVGLPGMAFIAVVSLMVMNKAVNQVDIVFGVAQAVTQVPVYLKRVHLAKGIVKM
jgi:hypothetical protein